MSIFKYHRKKPRRVLILGSGLPAERIAGLLFEIPETYEIIGYLDDQSLGADSGVVKGVSGRTLRKLRCLGPIDDLTAIIESSRPNRVIIALSERRGKLPVRELLTFRMNGIVVEDWIDAYERVTGKVAIESLSPSTFLFSKLFEKHAPRAFVHRALDIVYAGLAFLFVGPLMAIIMMAIKLDSPGPALFVHKRMGYKGRPFDLLKFRTMIHSDRQESEWVRDNESRVTRVGRVLRKYRLDELPQFINILVGQMALIGPRPHPVSNAGLFFDEIPYYLIRSKVRPGVTGWAQIRFGYANDLDEETEKMRYDLYYIKHQSVFFDFRILAETMYIVLFGRGSADITQQPDYNVRGQETRQHEYGWQTTQKRDVPSQVAAQPALLQSHESASWSYEIAAPGDLAYYPPAEQRLISSEIREQLGEDPTRETRNRRMLRNSPLAPWELRADKFRIFYAAEEDSRRITVMAVGHKQGNRLFIRGQEIAL